MRLPVEIWFWTDDMSLLMVLRVCSATMALLFVRSDDIAGLHSNAARVRRRLFRVGRGWPRPLQRLSGVGGFPAVGP
jgi:hypothetical protein